MRRALLVGSMVSSLVLGGAAWAQDAGANEADAPSGIAVLGALGTDVNLGLGFGAGVSWILEGLGGGTPLEVNGQLFYSHSTWDDDEGIHDYSETTDISVLALRVNALFRYAVKRPVTFYMLGVGAAAVSVEWEERSPTDTSLGTPLDAGGSKQSVEGTVGGAVFSAGIGRTFGNGLELRFELPILYLVSEVGEAAALVPTATVGLAYRF